MFRVNRILLPNKFVLECPSRLPAFVIGDETYSVARLTPLLFKAFSLIIKKSFQLFSMFVRAYPNWLNYPLAFYSYSEETRKRQLTSSLCFRLSSQGQFLLRRLISEQHDRVFFLFLVWPCLIVRATGRRWVGRNKVDELEIGCVSDGCVTRRIGSTWHSRL